MSAFIAISALLLAGAVGALAWPLWRTRRGETAGDRSGTAAVVVAAVLPIAAFAIYFLASNWDWRAPEQPPALTGTDIRRAVTELEAQLARQPDDVEAWKLLGRSATVIGDYPRARKAFGEAYARTQGRDAEAVVGYAESAVLIDETQIDGEAGALFERAVELAPENPRALWYAGIVAYRRGDMALAQQRWVELQQHDLPPDLRQIVAERLAELDRGAGAQPAARANDAQPDAIALTVDLSPALADRVPADATLFLIARRGSGGPPLAVQRRAVGRWPVVASLSDADAMLPGTRLADGGPVTVVARISARGQPIAASGDLYGEVGYDFASAHPVQVTIDRIVP